MSIEPEVLTFIGVIIAAAIGAIAYAFVRNTKNTNFDVDVAKLIRDQTNLLATIADQNDRLNNQGQEIAKFGDCVEQLRIVRDQIEALQAEADSVEKIREENRRLKAAMGRLRRRVKELEDALTAAGINPPPEQEETE